jgi:hypothetical protein
MRTIKIKGNEFKLEMGLCSCLEDEALDGDQVDSIVEWLRDEINLHEGNITLKEYERLSKN